MKQYRRLMAALLLGVGTMANAAPMAAQERNVVLKGDVMVEKTTTNEAGETSVELVAPDTVVPGDKLIFGTDYSNNGAETVENFTVTNPVPPAVMLAPEAAADLMVSIDGGTTWGRLAELTVANDDGTSRTAEHADVTHIRWTLPTVAPGESGRVEFPAIIR